MVEYGVKVFTAKALLFLTDAATLFLTDVLEGIQTRYRKMKIVCLSISGRRLWALVLKD